MPAAVTQRQRWTFEGNSAATLPSENHPPTYSDEGIHTRRRKKKTPGKSKRPSTCVWRLTQKLMSYIMRRGKTMWKTPHPKTCHISTPSNDLSCVFTWPRGPHSIPCDVLTRYNYDKLDEMENRRNPTLTNRPGYLVVTGRINWPGGEEQAGRREIDNDKIQNPSCYLLLQVIKIIVVQIVW